MTKHIDNFYQPILAVVPPDTTIPASALPPLHRVGNTPQVPCFSSRVVRYCQHNKNFITALIGITVVTGFIGMGILHLGRTPAEPGLTWHELWHRMIGGKSNWTPEDTRKVNIMMRSIG